MWPPGASVVANGNRHRPSACHALSVSHLGGQGSGLQSESKAALGLQVLRERRLAVPIEVAGPLRAEAVRLHSPHPQVLTGIKQRPSSGSKWTAF
jgi:hypothetical protein